MVNLLDLNLEVFSCFRCKNCPSETFKNDKSDEEEYSFKEFYFFEIGSISCGNFSHYLFFALSNQCLNHRKFLQQKLIRR